jgi:hypothetical protein
VDYTDKFHEGEVGWSKTSPIAKVGKFHISGCL